MSAVPRPSPESNNLIDFKSAVREFCDWIFKNCKDERTRAYAYIFRHSLYYRDPNPRYITLDEFARGRRRSEKSGGGRIDDGCGIPDRSNARRALASLVKDGHVTTHDEGDPARKKRFYRLTLPCIQGCSQSDYSDMETIELEAQGVVKLTTQSSQVDHSEGSIRPHGVVNSTTRSVVNPFEKTIEKTIEKGGMGETEKKEEGNEPLPQANEQPQPVSEPIEKPAPAPPACQDQDWQAKNKWEMVKEHMRTSGGISPAAFDNWIKRSSEGWAIQDDVLWVFANGTGTIHQLTHQFRYHVASAMYHVAPGLQVRYFIQEASA